MNFLAANALTNVQIDAFSLGTWSFSDPVAGGGQLTGTLTVAPENVESVKRNTVPDNVALYAVENDSIVWGGPIVERVWNSRSRELTLTASGWETWFDFALNPALYYRANIDQLDAAREIATLALNKPHAPRITVDSDLVPAADGSLVARSTLGGVFREITYNKYRTVGEMLDQLAGRDNGFEWSVQLRWSATTGQIEPYLAFFYPERTTEGRLLLNSGGNVLNFSCPESSLDTREGVIGLGTGQPPDQLEAADYDPYLYLAGYGGGLYRESTTSYSSVSNYTTLYEHARGERLARAVLLRPTKVDVRPDRFPVESYLVGDRARVILQDDFTDLDLPAVKIVDRAVSGVRSTVTHTTLLLQLSDVERPATVLSADDTPASAPVTP